MEDDGGGGGGRWQVVVVLIFMGFMVFLDEWVNGGCEIDGMYDKMMKF